MPRSARRAYSEQALIRIWAWGVGPHIILNRLKRPFSLFLFMGLVGYILQKRSGPEMRCESIATLAGSLLARMRVL